MVEPRLSVVVTSYTLDRRVDIAELFKALQGQTYPNLELIFVSDGSRPLYEWAGAHVQGKNILNAKLVMNPGETGISAARNVGLAAASGQIIAFIDDDALPLPDWAEEMARTFEDPSVIGATGPAFPLWEDAAMSWFPEEFYWVISCTAWNGWDKRRRVRNAWGMNMSFRREAFADGEHFRLKFGLREGKGALAEDDEFSLRVRGKTGKCIVYNPRARVMHKVYRHRLTFRFIAQRAYQIGWSRRLLQQLYSKPQRDEDFLETERTLLRRIFFRLFPDIVKGFLNRPVRAWRKLKVTLTALTFVTLGYYSHLFAFLLKHKTTASFDRQGGN